MLVDPEVIIRAREGDDAAFNLLVQAYRKRILGTIARLIGRPEDVEDVGQEVFLRLYYSLGQLRSPEIFEPWLYRLTVNSAYDYLRRHRRRREARMADLSEQQVLLTLKEIEGLSLKELEKVYGVNENALKVRLFRARQRVLKVFEASERKSAGAGV